MRHVVRANFWISQSTAANLYDLQTFFLFASIFSLRILCVRRSPEYPHAYIQRFPHITFGTLGIRCRREKKNRAHQCKKHELEMRYTSQQWVSNSSRSYAKDTWYQYYLSIFFPEHYLLFASYRTPGVECSILCEPSNHVWNNNNVWEMMKCSSAGKRRWCFCTLAIDKKKYWTPALTLLFTDYMNDKIDIRPVFRSRWRYI